MEVLEANRLGDGERLVTQVVPGPLLEFSRSVMRQRFSTILQKPVYTFTFDRFTAASPELLSKLLQARQLSLSPPASGGAKAGGGMEGAAGGGGGVR